jgi:antibiotic biosynthesis monooxygenase (ABM) superfamily enzyme
VGGLQRVLESRLSLSQATQQGGQKRPGSVVIVQQVRPGCEDAYHRWSQKINQACSQFPGFVDLEVFEPLSGQEQRFVIVVRFGTAAESDAWHNSEVCAALREEARPLIVQAVHHAPSSVYGSWFSRTHASRPPTQAWKDALVVLLVLYPTVMLLNQYGTGPLLRDWSPPVAMYLGNLVCVALLTWVLMPRVTRWLSFWLNPVPGQERKVLYKGLAIVLGGQLFMVALFNHLLKP